MNDKLLWSIHRPGVAALVTCLSCCVSVACGGSGSKKPTPDGGAPLFDGGEEGGRSSGGTRGSGGRSGDGGRENSGGSAVDSDAAADGAVPQEGDCESGSDPGTASLCLSFAPETVNFRQTPDLDGKGLLVVTVFASEQPSGSADVLASTLYPAATGPGSTTVEIGSLPTLRFTGLPEVVYVQTRFVDNLAGLESESGLAYGMFVGGIQLADGIRPAGTGRPRLRALNLAAGKGTSVRQKLTALRKFTTTVALALPGGRAPDDAEGPLSVGAFGQAQAIGAPVFGGGELPCVDLKKGPVPVTGFFYVQGITESGADVYFGGQLDDFGRKVVTPPGALVSATADLLIPPAQVVKVMPGDYSVSIDRVSLNFVVPGYDGFAPFSCPDGNPVVDAGVPEAGPSDSGTTEPGPKDSGGVVLDGQPPTL